MPTPPSRPVPDRPRPDLSPGFWFLAGLAGTTATAVIAVAQRFGHLSPGAQVFLAALVGMFTMVAFAPWKQIRGRARERDDVRKMIRCLREFERDQRREPLRPLRTDRDDDLGRLQRALYDVLASATAQRLEARRLRRTMDHSIRKETTRATGRLKRQAQTDPLTGLGNRRALDEQFPQLVETCEQEGRPLSTLVIDLDRFKQVNDQLGHDIGDECLAFLGKLLGSSLREHDLAFRTGGDEFIVLMPGAPAEVGRKVADRIRKLYGQMAWPHKDPPRPTLSVGVATARAGGLDDPVKLISRADEAMYAAKRGGRAQVTEYSGLRGAA